VSKLRSEVPAPGLPGPEAAVEALPLYVEDLPRAVGRSLGESVSTKEEIVARIKQRGTSLFKLSQLEGALRLYKKALLYLILPAVPSNPEGDLPPDVAAKGIDANQELGPSLILNQVLCLLQLGRNEAAWGLADVVVRLREGEPEAAKALYRRGCAALALLDFRSAVVDLKAAADLQPTDTAVRRKLAEATKLKKTQKNTERRTYSAMFE